MANELSRRNFLQKIGAGAVSAAALQGAGGKPVRIGVVGGASGLPSSGIRIRIVR